MTQSQVNLITESGRETLSVSERIALLRADLMLPPLIGIAPGEGPTPNQAIHDIKLTVGWIRSTITLYERAVSRGQTDATLAKGANLMLSDIECIVLAWRRGGHVEYNRVRRAQRDHQSSATSPDQ